MRITALTVKDAKGEVYSNILSHRPKLPHDVYWTNFHANVDGALIEAGKRLDLLILEGDATSASFRTARNAVRRRLSELTVRVEYQDLYERKMLPEEKTLSWFGRHQK